MLGHSGPQMVSEPDSSSKKSTHPNQFMFIDCSLSNGGENAKPDKGVRSFVMKSARRKKSWSTTRKNREMETSKITKHRQNYSSRDKSSNQKVDAAGTSLSECTASRDTQLVFPASSSRSNSIVSHCSGLQTGGSLTSSSTSSPVEETYADDTYTYRVLQQINSQHQARLHVRVLPSFDCLVVSLGAKAERLLHRFAEATAPRLIPIDPHGSSEACTMSWITGCVQSSSGAPFIYAAIASSLRAAQFNSETYKWRATSEVNRLLSDPETSTNDATIAAVLILLAIEETDLSDPRRRGDERRSSMTVKAAHHNGLRTLIQQRGGLAAFSGNKCLQVCLLMHSIAQTITTFKPPYAVLVDGSGHVEDYAQKTRHSSNAFAHILQDFRRLNVDRSLLNIAFTITVFTTDLMIWYQNGVCPFDSLELQKHSSLLMFRLFGWYQNNERDKPDEPVFPQLIDRSICLALMIFMVNASEPNPASFCLRLSKAVVKLRVSLERVPIADWNNAPDLLSWVATMGILGTRSPAQESLSSGIETERMFFRNYINSALSEDELNHTTSAEQLLKGMRSCLWIPSVFDDRFRTTWMSTGPRSYNELRMGITNGNEGNMEVEDDNALGHSTAWRFFNADRISSG